MHEDIPDGGDVAIFDVDGAEQKGNTKRETIEFEEKNWDKKPGPGWSDTVDKGKNENDYKVDENVDDGSEGCRNDNDVLRETNFADEVTTIDDGLDALVGAFSEEAPESSTD